MRFILIVTPYFMINYSLGNIIKKIHPRGLLDNLNMFYFCPELIGPLVLFSILGIINILFISFPINFFNLQVLYSR